jgi:hypothetical protein
VVVATIASGAAQDGHGLPRRNGNQLHQGGTRRASTGRRQGARGDRWRRRWKHDVRRTGGRGDSVRHGGRATRAAAYGSGAGATDQRRISRCTQHANQRWRGASGRVSVLDEHGAGAARPIANSESSWVEAWEDVQSGR